MKKYAHIYLDYAAATPLDTEVQKAMLPYYADIFCNPSAPYTPARLAAGALEDARRRIAAGIGAKAHNIIFTAGASEANNLACASATQGGILAAATEHTSILACVQAHGGTTIPVDTQGFVQARCLKAALTDETQLVSISLANGEIGTIQPMRKLAEIIKQERLRRLQAQNKCPLWLHCDCSQAANTLSINVSTLGVDLLTLSAAKIYGPKQTGALWIKDTVTVHPLIYGGGQEGGARSGTENVANIVGFARAFELAVKKRADEARRLCHLRDKLKAMLLGAYPFAVISGPHKKNACLPGLLHISFPGLEAHRLVIALDERGVYVGTGSACAANKARSSHVLQAIGLDEKTARGCLRITLGRQSTADKVEQAAAEIIDVVAKEYARSGAREGLFNE